jgi:serine/threonine protein kinase
MSSSDCQAELSFVKLAFQNQFVERKDAIQCLQAWAKNRKLSLRELVIDVAGLEDSEISLIDQICQHHSKASRSSAAALDAPTFDFSKPKKGFDESEIESFLALLCQPATDVTAAPVSSQSHHDETTGLEFNVDQISSQSRSSNTTVVKNGEKSTRFQIKDLHAQGGLGEVFIAIDEELDRKVALKQIRPRFADDGFARERFELEATITGGLEHPGIVPVYGFGKHGDGRPFYAMRFIHGNSMKDAIIKLHKTEDRNRAELFSKFEFRNLLEQFNNACHAIAYAHSRGVIHRDIKPSNIMLGNFGETLVVDWGLAKCVGRKDQYADFDASTLMPVSGSQASATVHGSTIGTPPFMSPEQANGDLESMGPRSDIYSLGASLYMILTGSVPYGGQSSREVVEAAKKGQFQIPIKKNPLIPKALNAICCKAMSLSPDDRYATAQELATEIQLWMADQPVSAYQDPWSVKTLRWLRQHRTLAVSSALAVSLVAIAATVGAVLINAEKNETKKALVEVDRQRELTVKALNAETVALQQTQSLLDSLSSDLVSDVLTQSDELTTSDRKFLEKMEDHFLEFASFQPESVEPLVRANGRFKLAEIQRKLDQMDASLKSSELAIDDYETALPTISKSDARRQLAKFRLAKANGFRGLVLKNKKDLTLAAEAYVRSQRLLRELADEYPENAEYTAELANLLVNKANLLSEQSKPTEATTAYLLAEDYYKSLENSDISDSPRFLLVRNQRRANYASLLSRNPEKAAAAADIYRQCKEGFERLVQNENRPEHRNYLANCLNNLGNCLLAAEKSREAVSEFRRSVELQTALVDEFPLRQKFRIELGRAHLGLGKSLGLLEKTGAESNLLQAKNIFSELTLDSSADASNELADTLLSLGKLYGSSNPGMAETMFTQANEIRARILKDAPPTAELLEQILATDINWANFLRKSEKYESAVEVYGPLLKRLDEREVEPDNFTRLALFGLADCYVKLGKSAEALPLWTRLCEIPSDPNWTAFEQQRAICLVQTGKIPEGVNAADALLLEGEATPVMYYDAACCNALAAGYLDENEKAAGVVRNADWYRDRAMNHLEMAADEGFFKDEKMRVHASTDHDLDALRQLDEFETFCRDNNIPINKPK